MLTAIGGKMIYDSAKKEREKPEEALELRILLTLAIATSIDALMVGLSLAFLQTALIEPILIIGVMIFSLSLLGFLFGCGLGQVFGNKVKIIGGLILFAICGSNSCRTSGINLSYRTINQIRLDPYIVELGALMVQDVVCGMEIDEKTAKWKSEYKGKTYYFCGPMCKLEFDDSPEKYVVSGDR